MRFVSALALAFVLMLAAACSSGDDATVTPTSTAAPSSSLGESTTATSAATATPTVVPGGSETALDVPEGGGAVPLAAGAYRTARFQPQAHFSLADGWSAAYDSARFLDLFRGADPAANCVCLLSPDGVIDPVTGTKAALPGTGSVDDMINYLISNPNLKTSNPSSLEITNIAARQLDVEVRTGIVPVDKVDYLTAGDQTFSVKAGERQHLVILSVRDAPVVIAQRSPAEEYNDYFTFVEQVVGTLTFAN